MHISGGVQSCQEPGSIFQHHSAARAVPANWPGATGEASAARACRTSGSGNLEEQGCELEIVAGRGVPRREAGTAMSEIGGRDGLISMKATGLQVTIWHTPAMIPDEACNPDDTVIDASR